MSQWYVYIMSNRAHRLYTGITNDLPRRVTEHKERTHPNAFTARYTFDRLVFYDGAADQVAAALREKRIKNWPREKRVALIQAENPNWNDLSAEWNFARWLR
ncbi:MAG TPA: GIY-YIG nuclease family protein [Thermoanaerobaculia bacterium]|jgi:putative endonuclease